MSKIFRKEQDNMKNIATQIRGEVKETFYNAQKEIENLRTPPARTLGKQILSNMKEEAEGVASEISKLIETKLAPLLYNGIDTFQKLEDLSNYASRNSSVKSIPAASASYNKEESFPQVVRAYVKDNPGTVDQVYEGMKSIGIKTEKRKVAKTLSSWKSKGIMKAEKSDEGKVYSVKKQFQ